MVEDAIKALTQELIDLYLAIPKATSEELAALTARADAIQAELDVQLSAETASFSESQITELIKSLAAAKTAANEACRYLESELKATGEEMTKIRSGQKVNRAYQPPAVGMGFTEGTFIDSKK